MLVGDELFICLLLVCLFALSILDEDCSLARSHIGGWHPVNETLKGHAQWCPQKIPPLWWGQSSNHRAKDSGTKANPLLFILWCSFPYHQFPFLRGPFFKHSYRWQTWLISTLTLLYLVFLSLASRGGADINERTADREKNKDSPGDESVPENLKVTFVTIINQYAGSHQTLDKKPYRVSKPWLKGK